MEILLSKPPDFSHLRFVGFLCYTHVHTTNKIQARGHPYVFMSYPYGKKGWTLYDLEENKVIVSRDVHFIKDQFLFSQIST